LLAVYHVKMACACGFNAQAHELFSASSVLELTRTASTRRHLKASASTSCARIAHAWRAQAPDSHAYDGVTCQSIGWQVGVSTR
jgi:hypothetical protein